MLRISLPLSESEPTRARRGLRDLDGAMETLSRPEVVGHQPVHPVLQDELPLLEFPLLVGVGRRGVALAADRVDGLFTGLMVLVDPPEFIVFPEEKLLDFLFIHAAGPSAVRITYRPDRINFAPSPVDFGRPDLYTSWAVGRSLDGPWLGSSVGRAKD